MSKYATEIMPELKCGHGLLYDDDDRILYKICRRGSTYLEIGTYCGGSAIVAGLAGCEVYCIDTWEYPEDMKTFRPTPDDVRANWAAAGLDPDRLHLYKQEHPPFPTALRGLRFDIGFVDGGHDAKSAYADWVAVSKRVDKYVMFHDANRAGPYWAMLKAIKNPNWGRVALPFGCTTTVRVLKRIAF